MVSKDIEKNIVFVSKNYELLSQSRMEFKIESGNFINEDWLENENIKVKLRHGPKMYNCDVMKIPSGYTIKIHELIKAYPLDLLCFIAMVKFWAHDL